MTISDTGLTGALDELQLHRSETAVVAVCAAARSAWATLFRRAPQREPDASVEAESIEQALHQAVHLAETVPQSETAVAAGTRLEWYLFLTETIRRYGAKVATDYLETARVAQQQGESLSAVIQFLRTSGAR